MSEKKATAPWGSCTQQQLLDMLCGNAHALHVVNTFVAVSHAYDDLIDKDKEVEEARIHGMISAMLVDLPNNPFYRANQQAFATVAMLGALNWRAANEMEASGSEEELHIAHSLRYSIADIALLAMALTGGREHAAKHARMCRLWSQNDTWEHYRSEHLNAEA